MNQNFKLFIIALLSLFSGIFLLISLDEGTLFLATLLVAVVAIKIIHAKIDANATFDTSTLMINITTGLWFALSIAPAFGVNQEDILILSNGFLIQTLLSFVLFIIFYKSDISIIGKIKVKVKGGVGIIVSALIAGAAAGISASSLWQVYLNLSSTVSISL
jgi:phosphatidylglycerophosphatase A